ncbi:MAG: hypothetical protein JWO38_5944 [Gemmataceae bacterium]|nr:hypothetical protein [Gemmataceae bacterium]
MVPQRTRSLKGLTELLPVLQDYLLKAATSAQPVHEVERHIWEQVLAIGRPPSSSSSPPSGAGTAARN